jgi:hypothetical protein
MIDTSRQVPSVAAAGWSIDLTAIGGPVLVVLRLSEREARQALVRHLVDIGSIPNTIEAERIVAVAPVESVGVVW